MKTQLTVAFMLIAFTGLCAGMRVADAQLQTAAVGGQTNGVYDSATALDALYYVKASYCDYTQLRNWTCDACTRWHTKFTDVNYQRNATDDFLYFSGYNPESNKIVIAFRGTSNWKNWIVDFDAILTTYPHCDGCKVHQGFYYAWHSVQASVVSDFERLKAKYPTATLLVTGHSLGASVAVLGATSLALKNGANDRQMELYTFGCPRTGNPAFAAWLPSALYQSKQFRVTHHHDPIPHLPGEFMGYRHTYHELWYDNDTNNVFRNCTDTPDTEDPKCADSVSVFDYDPRDHVRYLGICTNCVRQVQPDGYCPL